MNAEPSPGWSRFTWWRLLALIVVFRLLYLPLFCAVTDLAGDESYYWEWGRRPDWGYYSKPPLIGWLMGVTGLLTGHSEWGIRLAALLTGTATLAFLASLAGRMSGARAAAITVALAALTPANVALNLFFTIDAPLLLCWSAALLCFWRCLEKPGAPWRWALLALALGAGNLAKQMMLVFPLLMLLLLAVSPALRPLLRRPALWLTLLASLAFLAPVLFWQASHGWITLEHTKEHFHAADHLTVARWLGRFFSFPAAQAMLFSPVTWVLLIAGAVGGLWKWRRLDARQQYLVMFSGPALAAFFLLALRQEINPNWPAAYYLAAMVLVAGGASGQAGDRAPGPVSPRLLRLALVVAAVFTGLAYLLPLSGPAAAWAGWKPPEAMRRLRGWSESGAQADALLARTPRPRHTFVLALGHRESASQFAFYMPAHPRVYRWQPDGHIASQYELWPSAAEQLGNDALLLQPTENPLPSSLIRAFASVEPLGLVEVPLGGGDTRRWQAFLGRELKSWPAARKTPSP